MEMRRRQRDLAVIGWASFLIASASTMLFFAWIDPKALSHVAETPLPHDRMTGYALGFFFFWVVAAAAAALTVYLIRTRHGHPPPRD
jgi:membrane protein insertase Oxa1/YidC/SpoIIIJ